LARRLSEATKERAVFFGNLIADSDMTVREVEEKTGVAKSTIHEAVTKILKEVRPDLAIRVENVFLEHISRKNSALNL